MGVWQHKPFPFQDIGLLAANHLTNTLDKMVERVPEYFTILGLLVELICCKENIDYHCAMIDAAILHNHKYVL